jgi:hypothetical protein
LYIPADFLDVHTMSQTAIVTIHHVRRSIMPRPIAPQIREGEYDNALSPHHKKIAVVTNYEFSGFSGKMAA